MARRPVVTVAMEPNWAALVELKESWAWWEKRKAVDGVRVLADLSPAVALVELTGWELKGRPLNGVSCGIGGAGGMSVVCSRGSCGCLPFLSSLGW